MTSEQIKLSSALGRGFKKMLANVLVSVRQFGSGPRWPDSFPIICCWVPCAYTTHPWHPAEPAVYKACSLGPEGDSQEVTAKAQRIPAAGRSSWLLQESIPKLVLQPS